ncbi:MAG: isoprenylcysteine carboxylmethyltransferase family protein [Elusimicrobia bacterium]|nr:isoprenylcysteine carboxylmethyltransferase family protein [Elusimicrobiota bacterium]
MGGVTFRDMLRVLPRKEFTVDMAVFFCVCVPAVLGVLVLARKADRLLGWAPFVSPPWSILLFIVLTLAGGALIWNAYTYLVFVGEGSPCPQYGGPKRLVKTGPYSLVRHPSVIGKLSGIVGLGCLSGSCTFTFLVIPLLLTWSVFYNRYIQEAGCVERFGAEYLEYRRQVPMLIPRLGGIASFISTSSKR